MTDQIDNEPMTLPKDRTTRTDEPNFAVEGVEIRPRVGSNECFPNLNRGRKRYRKSIENTIDVGRPNMHHDHLMQKIRVTKVACSELSQPVKPESESCIPHENHSNFLADHPPKEAVK